MIVYSLYLLLFLSLIYCNGFFGLFKDSSISAKKLSLFFLGKALAVPVFLYLHTKLYGGIENLDTGKFYHDVKTIYDYGKTDLHFLVRVLFGLQDDAAGSADYELVLKNTLNWDNGTAKDYFYNDNRIVIRLHILLNLLTCGFYPAHALFSCFLSFCGIFFLYKTFKEWFVGKEVAMVFIFCFFPSLWFYTGALLKEGITIFILGSTLYNLKKIAGGEVRIVNVTWLLFLVFLSLLLKPYLLLFSVFCFGLFFLIQNSKKITRKILFYFSFIFLLVIFANGLSVILKHRSLLEAAKKHQQRFIGISKGGIFLSDSITFIRLNNDTNQIIRHKKDHFKIKKNTSYMYWRGSENDTLFVSSNTDTSSVYKLEYIIQASNSNILLPTSNGITLAGAAFYYTLFYPTLFSTKSAIQVLAAAENLVILLALVIVAIGLIKSKKRGLLPLVFLFFTLTLCLLIGFTAPNSGAIFRYRSPAMLFLLLAALYYFEDLLPLYRRERKRSEGSDIQ